MNTSPDRSQEEPQNSPQHELFQKLSHLRGVLRSALIDITRIGVKECLEDLEMDLLFQDFAREFGLSSMALTERERHKEEHIAVKKRIQELSREITELLREYGKNQKWSKGRAAKAKLLLYLVEEFVRGL
jgi:hypothetical protein